MLKLLSAAAIAVFTLASAQAAELRIGQSGEVTSIDPHYHNNRFNLSFRHHVFESLTTLDERSFPQPKLAESWRAIDSLAWEFKLRPNVLFENGEKLTANDVVYSLCRALEVKDSPANLKGYISSIVAIAAPDPLTLVIKTGTPNAQLAIDLSSIGIISAQGATATFKPNGCGLTQAPTRVEFDSGKLAIGSGPYRVVAYQRGRALTLERNPRYWGGPPPWEQVRFLTITDESMRVARLLAGDVDMIEDPSVEDLQDLESDPAVTVTSIPSSRIIYLALDQHQEPSPGVSGADGKNPLKDHRVREAISKAIDRATIVQDVLSGQATAIGQLLAPGSFGYHPDLPPVFDPVAARRLLVEAGYPKGFDLVLNGPNDRYQQDDKILSVVASMLREIGVRAVAQPEPSNSFFERRGQYQFSLYLAGFSLPNADTALKNLVASRNPALGLGAANYGRYANPTVDALILQALGAFDGPTREKLLQTASAAAMQDYAVLPLHAEKTTWALRKGLHYSPRADQYSLAMDVKPVEAKPAP